MTDTDTKFTGRCACHYISYHATQHPLETINCHCTTCRKQSGAPYQTWATFPPGSIIWDGVGPTYRRSSDVASRSRCPRCGSSICMVYDCAPERLDVAVGTLEEVVGGNKIPSPTVHIFLAEKASWYELPDDRMGKWEGFAPGMAEGSR